MHHLHCHSATLPNHCSLANMHSSPAASPYPHPHALYSSSYTAKATSQHSTVAPHISKGGITHPATKSRIHPGRISKGRKPNFHCASNSLTHHRQQQFPIGTLSQSHTSLFLHQVPHSAICHPCPRLQPQIPICLHYPLGFLSLYHQQSSISS
jgi:hypothetical protein